MATATTEETQPAAKKTAAAPAKKTAAAPRGRKPKKPDYKPGLTALTGQITGGLVSVGLMTNSDVLIADGYAFGMHSGNIVTALNDLGNEQPAVGAVLEKICKAGPYGAIIQATLPLVMQLAANHIPKVAGAAGFFGAQPPKTLVDAAKAEVAQMTEVMTNGSED